MECTDLVGQLAGSRPAESMATFIIILWGQVHCSLKLKSSSQADAAFTPPKWRTHGWQQRVPCASESPCCTAVSPGAALPAWAGEWA